MEISKKTRRDYDKPARPRREYDDKPAYSTRDDRKPAYSTRDNGTDGESGQRRTYSHKTYGEHRSEGYKSYGENRGGEHRTYGENRGGEHKTYGERRSSGEYHGNSERRTYGENRGGEHRTYGERKDFADRRNSTSGRGSYAGRRQNSDTRDGVKGSYGKSTYGQYAGERPEKPIYHKKDTPQTEVRLNKFIANSGICSRREADRLIQAGVVTVNGVVVTELGTKIDVRKDTVLFGDQRLRGEEKVYIIMNKPKGFVTTTSDPHAEQTVMDLLTKCPARVFPVGRLDKNTTGVLLFTNDGEMSEKLTHPSFCKKKIYEVTLDRKLTSEDFEKILSGINLEDGQIKADELDYVDASDQRVVGIEIHSGKNRIVRRIFESLGYQVKALDRVYFAGLTKKGIKRGQWRYLSEGEVNILKMGAFN